jgi:hypothetical protein
LGEKEPKDIMITGPYTLAKQYSSTSSNIILTEKKEAIENYHPFKKNYLDAISRLISEAKG